MNFYTIARVITHIVMRIVFKLHYEGTENIPREKGYILASNHRGYVDPVLLSHKVPGELHFLAKAELFQNKLFGFLISHLNAFPIDRGAGDTEPIEHAKGVVRGGGILLIFPEGHRSKDGKPLRARSGVGMLAAQTGADILPVAIVYGEKLRFRSPVTLRFGKLIENRELALDVENPRSWRSASKRVMDDIVGMLPEAGGA